MCTNTMRRSCEYCTALYIKEKQNSEEEDNAFFGGKGQKTGRGSSTAICFAWRWRASALFLKEGGWGGLLLCCLFLLLFPSSMVWLYLADALYLSLLCCAPCISKYQRAEYRTNEKVPLQQVASASHLLSNLIKPHVCLRLWLRFDRPVEV